MSIPHIAEGSISVGVQVREEEHFIRQELNGKQSQFCSFCINPVLTELIYPKSKHKFLLRTCVPIDLVIW